MQLEELIQSLALGELGGTKLFLDKPVNPDALYEMTKKQRATLINHINDATMAICTKIPLHWESTVLRLVEGQNTYELHSKHSILKMPPEMELPDEMIYGDEEAYYYIYDARDYPFRDNILSIQKVTSISGLYDISIGDMSYKNAVYTPRPNIIEIPEDMFENEEYVTLHFLGHIPRIPILTAEGSPYEVELPYSLIEAVSAFICHRIQMHPQDPNNASVGISHLERFNAICAEHMKQNIGNMSGDTNIYRFSQGGWV